MITSKFTIAIHVIACISYFKDKYPVTSRFLAGSTGANPVIIRNVMSDLKKAGIIESRQGKTGINITKPLNEITFYDIYKAIDAVGEGGIFRWNEKVNMKCPVGRNIHEAIGDKLAIIQKTMEDKMKTITMADVVDSLVEEINDEECAED